jgi:hypothetical protein
MFIIFGAKTVKTSVKNGLNLRKHCDTCHFLFDMREHRLRQYFTLFFIPVFPISKGESFFLFCKDAFWFAGKTLCLQ